MHIKKLLRKHLISLLSSHLISLLSNHRHYWGIPHERSSDKKLVQTCYECGAEREIQLDMCPVQVQTEAAME